MWWSIGPRDDESRLLIIHRRALKISLYTMRVTLLTNRFRSRDRCSLRRCVTQHSPLLRDMSLSIFFIFHSTKTYLHSLMCVCRNFLMRGEKIFQFLFSETRREREKDLDARQYRLVGNSWRKSNFFLSRKNFIVAWHLPRRVVSRARNI